MGGLGPMTVSLSLLCANVGVAFSFEASTLSFRCHKLWEVSGQRIGVILKCATVSAYCFIDEYCSFMT